MAKHVGRPNNGLRMGVNPCCNRRFGCPNPTHTTSALQPGYIILTTHCRMHTLPRHWHKSGSPMTTCAARSPNLPSAAPWVAASGRTRGGTTSRRRGSQLGVQPRFCLTRGPRLVCVLRGAGNAEVQPAACGPLARTDGSRKGVGGTGIVTGRGREPCQATQARTRTSTSTSRAM